MGTSLKDYEALQQNLARSGLKTGAGKVRVQRDIVVGIDPGASTGLAIRNHLTGEEIVTTTTFWKLIDRMDQLRREYDPATIHVWLEDGRLNAFTFEQYEEGEHQKREKISRNVGMNHAHTDLLHQRLVEWGMTVELVRPKDAKWDLRQYRMITGRKDQPSQHARDAAKLIAGL